MVRSPYGSQNRQANPYPLNVSSSFVAGGYWVSREPIRGITRAAIAVSTVRSIMLEKLYIADTLLERSAQDLKDIAAELGPFIQEEHAVVGQ
jgi:hypothetical protein